VVLVARWRKTAREQVSLAARLIQEAGGRIAGVVLSMVDQGAMKRFAGPEGWLYVEASEAAPRART
jgi:Mrp family chromosome partitioning ATPase